MKQQSRQETSTVISSKAGKNDNSPQCTPEILIGCQVRPAFFDNLNS